MREITRTRLTAMAKSSRATPEELREARERLKEIEAELAQIELLPETKSGEEREKRYERVLRLRAMRDEFERRYPIRQPRQPNSLTLALVMTVASFLVCALCGGTFYAAYSYFTQKPDPVATGDLFWSDMKTQNYADIRSNLMTALLRGSNDPGQFSAIAQQADQEFGVVTADTLTSESGDLTQNATLVYNVTRTQGKRTTVYATTLQLVFAAGSWAISDYGSAFTPPATGATPTPGASGTTTPGATPAGSTTPGG